MSRFNRYAMFALLYFAQGAILSYFTALNSLYLLRFNLTMSQIGLVGAIGLIPFVLKIFLGMLSDRVNLADWGYRKPYIIIGLLVQSVCLLIVPQINPGSQYGFYALLAFVLMLGMALYDTCTDGYALDTTPLEEQGTIQGFMVGGRALGVVAISALLGLLVENLGWPAAFYSLAVLSLIPLPLVFQIREKPRMAEQQFTWGAFRAFTKVPVISLAVLGALYSLIINGANQLVNPFLQNQFGISYATAGFVTTVWGIGVVLGSLAGGRLTDRWGHHQSVIRAMALSLVAILSLAFTRAAWMVWPLVILFGLAFGFYETVYFAVSMSKTDPRIAASMFSILMAVANIGTGIGLALSGGLVDSFGFAVTFIVLAGLNLLAIPLVGLIFGKRQTFPPPIS
ncbi:MAG: MFS transporter [Bellilinea sp.]|nr:MAG: MFS transporter [Bellilinea sp.]